MRILMLAVLAGAFLKSATMAMAGQPAYVGKWGKDAAHCKSGQEIMNAPMLISKNGYDSHEVHCKFTSTKKSGSTWTMKTKCSVEGDQQTGSLKLAIKGNSLIVDGSHKLQRCG
jgi:hypothetical protein